MPQHASTSVETDREIEKFVAGQVKAIKARAAIVRPDLNVVSIAYEENVGLRTFANILADKELNADALKVSHSSNGTVVADDVYGGREDCLDVNNLSHDLTISADWYPQGKYFATIKGGSHGITVAGTLHGHGTEVDVDLGNQSDQSSKVTSGIALNVGTLDGSAVKVRVWNAEMPQLLNGDVQKYEFVFPSQYPLWVRRFFYFAYWVGKKIGVAE